METQAATQAQTTSAPVNGNGAAKPRQEIAVQVESMRPQFKAALPSHITPEKFERTVLTALNLNPDLLNADRRSLLNAASKAASDGLLPDGRDGAFVLFNKKDGDRYVKTVTWMPMVAGIIKKARQSGEISTLGARIVYANEITQGRFTHKVVDGVPKVDHDPILWGDRGTPALVYAYVHFKDGAVDFEFLHADDVAKIRGVSKAKFGPWFDWPDEMWKKSAIRRLAKRLPLSSELFDTIARDDEMTEFEKQRSEAETRMLSSARALGAPTIDQAQPETGEIIDADNPPAIVPEGERDPDTANYLADMETELLALDRCENVKAVDKLEAEIGAAIKDEPDKLHAWSERCALRANEIMERKKK